MLKNYFKIAFRNLWRHKAFSLINIIGLAAGMSASLLIYFYVSLELSYDTYHTRADRIYRLVTHVRTPSEDHFFGAAPAMGPALRNDFPEVQKMARVQSIDLLVQKDDKTFQEDNILLADSSLFDIFSFPFLKGDPRTALVDPFSVVLSETAARKYFGKSDPMGQSLLLDEKFSLKVSGIMKDIPLNSHFRSDIIVSMTTLSQKLNPGMDTTAWNSFGGHTYLLFPEGANPQFLQAQLPAFIQKYAGKVMQKEHVFFTLSLEPLKSIYLHSKYGSAESGNIYNVYIFSIIAVFILVIACINFINLTTARSMERAKEVGIRKVIGSSRSQLVAQFLGESILLCLIAFLLSCLFFVLLLPVFNTVSGKIISPGVFQQPKDLLPLFLTALSVGLAAGLYPAIMLSGFRPALVLKGRFTSGRKGILLRQILVVLQFTIAIVLITGTLVAWLQLHYMRNQPLGFKKDQMMAINFHNDRQDKSQYETFKQQLLQIPGVLSACASSSLPSTGYGNGLVQIQNAAGEMQTAGLDMFFVDYDFFKQYQIQLVAGRGFSNDFSTDQQSTMIVNEATVKKFGYTSPAEIIGRRFAQGPEGTIIGVVKNFHYRSLQEEITPLVFHTEPRAYGLISLSLANRNLPSTLAAIENKWKQLDPQHPFSYFFVDEAFNKQYRGEENFGRLFLYFSVFAIFISCLGLLGLAQYSTLQRTKEIGIRKVLGASVSGIVHLLSRDFLKLVGIAFILGSPIAAWTMHKWLEKFAYRISIHWWVFGIVGLTAFLIALFTVSFQAIRAAISNPVHSLRAE
jgi:putative ABC transport system permease protein